MFLQVPTILPLFQRCERSEVLPVCPICQSTSACRIWATWRGMARSRRRLEWRPVACQKPEPSDRLVRRKGRDDCHDCHFCVPRVALQGAAGSGATETENKQLCLQQSKNLMWKIFYTQYSGFRLSCFHDTYLIDSVAKLTTHSQWRAAANNYFHNGFIYLQGHFVITVESPPADSTIFLI